MTEITTRSHLPSPICTQRPVFPSFRLSVFILAAKGQNFYDLVTGRRHIPDGGFSSSGTEHSFLLQQESTKIPEYHFLSLSIFQEQVSHTMRAARFRA